MQRKTELLDYLEVLQDRFSKAATLAPNMIELSYEKFKKDSDKLLSTLEQSELLVPIVGGFSAGKSTAINTLLGKELLPTAVTAETAIPAEIRYSQDEHILAITIDGKTEKHELSALVELSQNASQYQVVKVYVNSPVLQSIAPYVLIDMPGFDSSYEHHNQAILRYLSKGAYYLFFIAATDGTLRREDIRRIDDVVNMERDFSVVLTKKDLCAPSELETIKASIQDQVDTSFGGDRPVTTIDHNDCNVLCELIKKSDPNKLFNNLHILSLKDSFYSVSNVLNTSIMGLKSTKEESKLKISNMERALESIRSEYKSVSTMSSSGELADMQRRIVSKIEAQLNSSVSELALQARSSKDALATTIGDIVRGSLITELQLATSKVSSQTVKRFSDSIELKLDLNLDLSISDDWVQTLISSLQSTVMEALVTGSSIDPASPTTVPQSGGGGVTTILSGLALAIPNPILKVIFAILPGVIGGLFNQMSQSREDTQVTDVIRTQVIPSVLRKVEPEIAGSLRNASEAVATAVAEKFEARINEQKNILELAQDEAAKDEEQISASMEGLEVLRKEVNELTSTILLKEF